MLVPFMSASAFAMSHWISSLHTVDVFVSLTEVGIEIVREVRFVTYEFDNPVRVLLQVRIRIKSVGFDDVPPRDVFTVFLSTVPLMFDSTRKETKVQVDVMDGSLFPLQDVTFIGCRDECW